MSHDHGAFPVSGFLPYVYVADFPIPIYFIVVSLAFIAALFVLVRRTEKFDLPRNRALDLSLVLMISGFLGARFFHVFFEEPDYYFKDPLNILQFHLGGFVWYGGALTGTICTLLFARYRGEPIFLWLDVFAPVAALGYGLGRIACLLAGCCYGRSFVLLGESINDELFIQLRYPTQVFAVLWELGVFAILLIVEKEKPRLKRGDLFLSWIVLHSIGRIVMEAFRGDDRGPAVLGLSVSTVISIALLFAVIAIRFVKPRFAPTRSSSKY